MQARMIRELRWHIVVAALLGVSGGLVGCGPTSFVITPVPARQELQEQVVLRESVWATQKIALLDVQGVISNMRPAGLLGTGGENPVALFTEKLRKAAHDDHVRAVVLRINSPGGGVTASDIMYDELLRFKKESGKPVIASLQDVAASGGYYLACGADTIVAQPTTVTGSIGVIMMMPDLTGTMVKIGLDMNVIKSGPMKDAGSIFREMRPEERAHFQAIIDQMYARFVGVVAAHTRKTPDEVRTLADGRVYFATQAKDAGLIDAIGGLRDALALAKRAGDLADRPVKVVEYCAPHEYRSNIYATAPAAAAPTAPTAGGTQVNLINVELPHWLQQSEPQFLYLWAPGW